MRFFDTPLKIITDRFRYLTQSSIWLGVLMIGLFSAGFHFHTTFEHDAAEQAAIQNSGNLARAFEMHLSRSIKDIDRSLKTIRRNYTLNPEGFDFSNWLPSSDFADDQFVQLGIIGPDGILKLSTNLSMPPKKLNFSDREHFRVHLDAKNDNLFISKPIVGQTLGQWVIPITRRIELADGSFGGVIVAVVDPNYFSRFYNSFELGKNGRIVIVGLDGIVRAVGGHSSGQPGRDLSGGTLFEHHAKQAAGWFYTTRRLSDGIPRLISYRTAADYPLMIAIAISTDEIFAEATAGQRIYNIAGTIFTVLVLIVIGSIASGRMTRERISNQLHMQNQRFDAALNNMSQGLCMYDKSQRIIVANRRYREIYGFTEEQAAPGTAFQQILEHRRGNGIYDGPSPAEHVNANTDKSEEIQTHNNGNVIRLLRHPMPDGGWLTTFEDMTEAAQSKNVSALQKQRLDAALNSMPYGLCMFDAERRLVVWNDNYAKMYRMPPELLKAGTHHDEIVKHRVSIGILKGAHDDDAAQQRIAALSQPSPDGRTTRIDELADGRLILVNRERMKDGGWVTTHEDITERRKIEQENDRNRIFLNTILNNVPAPIFVKEAEPTALYPGQSRRRGILGR